MTNWGQLALDGGYLVTGILSVVVVRTLAVSPKIPWRVKPTRGEFVGLVVTVAIGAVLNTLLGLAKGRSLPAAAFWGSMLVLMLFSIYFFTRWMRSKRFRR